MVVEKDQVVKKEATVIFRKSTERYVLLRPAFSWLWEENKRIENEWSAFLDKKKPKTNVVLSWTCIKAMAVQHGAIVLTRLGKACSGERQESPRKDISGLYKMVSSGKFFHHWI